MRRRAVAKKIAPARQPKGEFKGPPWSRDFRHPSSRQGAPVTPGPYLIQSCPGDDWRRARWCDGAFHCGLTCQVWYAWREIPTKEGK